MNFAVEGAFKESENFYSELLFNPFPRASSTLITAPSFSGKSLFLKNIIERQDLYFRDRIDRVVILNCNPRVSFYTLQQRPECNRPLPVVQEYLVDEFNFDSLQDTDLCIVEDLQSLTDEIRLLLTALCHHANLVHLFLVAHGVLGQKNFELLSLVHRVLLFLQSTSVGRLASYIVQNFFLDIEIKDLLKTVLSVCSRNNGVLLLEINNLPITVQPYHVAISHLPNLQNKECSFAIVYPFPSKVSMYSNLVSNVIVNSLTDDTVAEQLPDDTDIVDGSFVLLNRANVSELKARPSGTSNHVQEDKCMERDQWDAVVLDLETQIEDFISHRYWLNAKSLLKEILRNSNICIMEDGRRMRMLVKPHSVVGITDFITAAVRKDGPGEILKSNTDEYRTYRLFARCMLDKHCPKSVFKNKILLQNLSSHDKAFSRKAKKQKWKFNRKRVYMYQE